MARDITQHKRPPITAKHKPRARQESRDHSSARGYGRRWERFRASFLAANPLCEFCLPKGEIRPAQVVDHDLPHRGDLELFWNNSFSALCKRCHDSTKQRMERYYSGDALLQVIKAAKQGVIIGGKRTWVETVPNSGATILYGAPCSGKTTAASLLSGSATIYDLDQIAEDMGLPRYGRTKTQTKLAMDRRMEMLAAHDPASKLVFIATAPLAKTRRYWASLLGAEKVTRIEATYAECIARMQKDPERMRHEAQQRAIIKVWFDNVE